MFISRSQHAYHGLSITQVVLIAGLSMPSLIKSLLVPHLTSNGFRVLLYDLYGRGYTEAPCASEVKYDTEMYVTQLALLLGHVGWDKAAIVGSSVGGGIAIAFSAHFPQMVDGKVGLIGSCGVMPQWEPPRSVRRAVSPALQYLRSSYLGKKYSTQLLTRKKIPPQLPTPVTQLVDKGHALMQDLEEASSRRRVILLHTNIHPLARPDSTLSPSRLHTGHCIDACSWAHSQLGDRVCSISSSGCREASGCYSDLGKWI
ncbi:Alpha/beta hydrolase [Heterobasidion irregulare TC 32-1]|uniref:Alpha/beta hydrolase n=1 Tax=Heterobasidion irregulare (strain TC 32-1) TaxID=747525 RepID=W4JQI7_HETIT|nr:Alpha/beta hydrolase [Heterobasidion irregulare TC 32-1]ETW75340.1 Alpha/beta hydrolase [Heterobasidion irregulare TC 32-1]